MNRLRFVSFFLAVGIGLVLAQPTQAQYSWDYPGARSYRPRLSGLTSRPRFSPYLNLYRRDYGVMDNYNTFVRPEKQLREQLRRQEFGIQRQGAGMHALGQQVQDLQREGTMRPTGTGSVFMNYSHYYQVRGLGGRRR